MERSVTTAVAVLHRAAVVATEAHDTFRFGARAAFPSDPRHFHWTRDTVKQSDGSSQFSNQNELTHSKVRATQRTGPGGVWAAYDRAQALAVKAVAAAGL